MGAFVCNSSQPFKYDLVSSISSFIFLFNSCSCVIFDVLLLHQFAISDQLRISPVITVKSHVCRYLFIKAMDSGVGHDSHVNQDAFLPQNERGSDLQNSTNLNARNDFTTPSQSIFPSRIERKTAIHKSKDNSTNQEQNKPFTSKDPLSSSLLKPRKSSEKATASRSVLYSIKHQPIIRSSISEPTTPSDPQEQSLKVDGESHQITFSNMKQPDNMKQSGKSTTANSHTTSSAALDQILTTKALTSHSHPSNLILSKTSAPNICQLQPDIAETSSNFKFEENCTFTFGDDVPVEACIIEVVNAHFAGATTSHCVVSLEGILLSFLESNAFCD